MNKHLQNLLEIIQQDNSMSADQKNAALKSLKDADKELEVTAFKLDKTEKVKQTTAVLLEETIAELEQKRKESQIELALERVRARTMAMYKSEELPEVIQLVFEQLRQLNFQIDSATFDLNFRESDDFNIWTAIVGQPYPIRQHIPYFNNPVFNSVKHAKEAGLTVCIDNLTFEEKNQFFDHFFKHTSIPEERRKFILSAPGWSRLVVLLDRIHLAIQNYSGTHYSEAEQTVLIRFAKVFEQTYTRFLDLQRAEAQAREALIEASLERVRSRTLAMHSSQDVTAATETMFDELQRLGSDNLRVGMANIHTNRTMDVFGITTLDGGSKMTGFGLFGMDEHPVWQRLFESWLKKEDFFTFLAGKEKEEYFKNIDSHRGYLPQQLVDFPDNYFHGYYFDQGIVWAYSLQPHSDSDSEIMKRFATVFSLTFRRYQDLRKAEAQAREAQIQASLERVRGRAMAIHKSDELAEVIQVIFQELQKLGFNLMECSVVLYAKNSKDLVYWSDGTYGAGLPTGVRLQYLEHPILIDLLSDFTSGIPYRSGEYSGELLRTWWDRVFTETDYRFSPEDFIESWKKIKQAFYSQAAMNHGFLEYLGEAPLPEDKVEIFKRFTKVVDLTYTRFEDVVKAEAQAREAQIEASLERVRSRTMAMHNSEDVVEATSVVFMELHRLGIETLRCGILIIDESKTMEVWSTTRAKEGQPAKIIGRLDMTIHPSLVGLFHAWKNKEEWYEYHLQGQDRINYYQTLSSIPSYQSWSQFMNDPDHSLHACLFNAGALYIFAVNPLSSEDRAVMKRFTVAFSQTFLRYRDLQKAEAQAMEALIEASLERVRSKTMAMHDSHDVGESVATLFDELVKLGVSTNRCGILIHDDTDISEVWTAKSNPMGKASLIIGRLDTNIHPMLRATMASWRKKESFFSYLLEGDDLKSYYEAINNAQAYPTTFDVTALPTSEVQSEFHFSEGSLFAFTPTPIPAESVNIFERFTGVFGQTYRRYLDLQKAEAQAREAQIEAALERVRAASMAMHKSQELHEVIKVISEQLINLGLKFDSTNFIRVLEDGRWDTWISTPVQTYPALVNMPYIDLVNVNEINTTIRQGRELIRSYSKEVKDAFFHHLFTNSAARDIPDARKEYVMNSPGWAISIFITKNIGLAVSNYQGIHFSETDNALIRRFSKVFEQSYTRFLDLQKAEAQALEAIKRTSVDRIRGEIASMRTTGDLQRITPLIWRELTTLGVPFIRCGVFIMDEELKQVHTFLSTPDGKAIATLHLPFDFDLSLTINAINHWRHNKIYKEHWDGAKFAESWAKLSTLSGISVSSPQAEAPPENLYIHMLPFLQGMLYVGNVAPLTDEMIHLLESVAEAFSTAYARYEDFNKLEAANSKIEKTLVDLKQTQTQLVQSEKMASLGELTAGIAHEIQNPLNFVNNFSEVNKELLTEMNDAIQKGNFNEAKTLAKDIIDNSEKINQHGKRADTIVKGMLQHSRTSSAVKEPTDINALADEYLRLAYHGLRAKDKTFNATTKTEFDSGIGPIHIIPQDIGRVILNLITNAFYAVTERNKLQIAEYKPTVVVSTKKMNGTVLITVKDNGGGIPSHIIDKIFQPFFTTKPTGQGTGLGLSMSYDIVKAHGGELRVETKEGEGSEFVVILPL